MILSIDQKISKKGIAILSIVLAALSSLSPFAIDSYAPAMPFMAEFFGCSLSDIELSMSIYLLGYAIGQFFGGPVSDSFGRKPVVLIGLLCFMISSYMISQSTQLTELYFFRFIQAVGGGFSIVVSMAIARDFFEGKELAKRISYISMIMMAAPLLAPAVGTLLLKLFSWEAIFSFLCIYSIFVLSLIMIFIPETRKKQSSKGLIRKTLINYWQVLANGQSMSYILAAALGFSGMFVFITGSSKLYIQYFQIPVEWFPLLFGSNVLVMMLLGGLNGKMVSKISPKKILNFGLWLQLCFGFLLFLIIILEWAYFVPVFILIVLFVGILGIIFGNANALVLHMYPNSSGTTTAVIGVTEFAIASFVGFLLHQIQNSSILPIAIMMFACSLAANLAYRLLK